MIPAWDKATDHFEKNPNDNRSSRTIAKELGVGKSTVNDARNSTVQRRTVDDDRPTIDNPPKGNLWDDQDDREDEDQTVS